MSIASCCRRTPGRMLLRTSRAAGRSGASLAATAPAALYLSAGKNMVPIGIDMPSADPAASQDLPSHHLLLRHGRRVLALAPEKWSSCALYKMYAVKKSGNVRQASAWAINAGIQTGSGSTGHPRGTHHRLQARHRWHQGRGLLRRMLGVVLFPETWKLQTNFRVKQGFIARLYCASSYFFCSVHGLWFD